MMKTVDTLMVLLFPFLDFIPFGLPRYWLFRDRLRIPFRYIVLLMCTVAAANSAAFYYINLGGYEAAAQWTTLMRYGFMLVNLAFSFLLIKESFPKLMFTYLLLVAWTFFVMGNANFIESRFFWDFSDLHPYLVYNIARVGFYLITCPFLLRFFYHTVADALKIEDKTMWRYLWKIPLFSAAFGLLYCFNGDVYAYATWPFMVSRYLMLFGACYVSYVALKVLEISRSRTQLEETVKYAGRSLTAQKKQFDTLAAHMDETRRARHDLRQHLAAVQSYIDHDDKKGLAEYVAVYKDRLPADTMEYFCANGVVNAVISYYAAQARDAGTSFAAKVTYPKNYQVSDTDIIVLIGNLLENAVEACKRDSADTKFIKLRVKQKGQSTLLVMVDNSCVSAVIFEDGTPLSSKREGVGIGVASVREIAARYNGVARFEQKDGVFYASVRLMLPIE
ncbi:sensor histidine kinase [Clostridium sp. AM58-1XD]|uniref:sensor histidine kinase n=1 Tax=Clostridium sp. AM58-1XD TaxID=2292307 RepID=UPI000E535AC6|nr:sensor histidine kinase [Clostridium sp. AM58-1XD]RGY97057.1 ATP-binding protein [Clostridium sp. AM58-1XD]